MRPEWLDLFPRGAVPPGENVLDGVVREVVFLGETIHVLVDSLATETMTVALRNEGQLTRPVPWRSRAMRSRWAGFPRTARSWRSRRWHDAGALSGMAARPACRRLAPALLRGSDPDAWRVQLHAARASTAASNPASRWSTTAASSIRSTSRSSAAPSSRRRSARVCCLLLGYPVAYAIARAGRWQNLLLFLVVLPFWTSVLVRTFAMIFLLRDTGLVNTALALARTHRAAAHPALHPGCGDGRTGLHLPALHGAADLRLAREARPHPAGSRRGARRAAGRAPSAG